MLRPETKIESPDEFKEILDKLDGILFWSHSGSPMRLSGSGVTASWIDDGNLYLGVTLTFTEAYTSLSEYNTGEKARELLIGKRFEFDGYEGEYEAVLVSNIGGSTIGIAGSEVAINVLVVKFNMYSLPKEKTETDKDKEK